MVMVLMIKEGQLGSLRLKKRELGGKRKHKGVSKKEEEEERPTGMNYIHGSPHVLFTLSRANTTSVCHYKNKTLFHQGLFIMCGIHVLC